MSRKKDAVEKTLDELSPSEQFIAVNYGQTGRQAMDAGVLMVANWLRALAVCKRLCPHESEKKQRSRIRIFGDYSKELESLLLDAAASGDGHKVRLLADTIQVLGPMSGELNGGTLTLVPGSVPFDPLRSILLALKTSGAPKMEARQVRDYIAMTTPGNVPSLKSVYRVAGELGAPLAEGKTGPEKGIRQRRRV